MPDDVAFCPGCGLRIWVPGREVSKPTPRPLPARPPAVNIPPASVPAAGTSVLPKNRLTAAVAYMTFLPALFFVLVEPYKRNRFVRFHSFQSIFLAVATILVAVVLRVLYSLLVLIPVLGFLLAWLVTGVALLGLVILWLVLLVKALQGETIRLPWLGGLAEKT
jgi:uncharacterized membrane protein